jgi:hypothetical protein
MKKTWQVSKLISSIVVAGLLVTVIAAHENDGQTNIWRIVGYLGFSGFLLLCCIALGWDSLKKLRTRSH